MQATREKRVRGCFFFCREKERRWCCSPCVRDMGHAQTSEKEKDELGWTRCDVHMLRHCCGRVHHRRDPDMRVDLLAEGVSGAHPHALPCANPRSSTHSPLPSPCSHTHYRLLFFHLVDVIKRCCTCTEETQRPALQQAANHKAGQTGHAYHHSLSLSQQLTPLIIAARAGCTPLRPCNTILLLMLMS